MAISYPGFDRITSDLRQLGGRPCVRGTRLSVRRVLDALADNPSWAELQRDFPSLELEDIEQILGFAAASIDGEVLALKPAG